jgi:hypothetical protein
MRVAVRHQAAMSEILIIPLYARVKWYAQGKTRQPWQMTICRYADTQETLQASLWCFGIAPELTKSNQTDQGQVTLRER